MLVSEETIADARMHLSWSSEDARHLEVFHARGVNLWRDLLPDPIRKALEGSNPGQEIRVVSEPGEILPAVDDRRRMTLSRNRFDIRRLAEAAGPRRGRFYPQGLISGLPQVFPQNAEPFRCTGVENGSMLADLNHPLAGKCATIDIRIDAVREKADERGGTCHVWIEELADGPGMQARFCGRPTDFFSDDPFARKDEAEDGAFYRKPRMVQHIDNAAIGVIGGIYGRFLKPGMEVLDLMSSWQSHLPEEAGLASLTGLGMNAAELDANRQLTRRVVHDLNRDPALPFADRSFDAAICTVSVEYLVRPFDVFSELARVLRADAPLIVTFSDRWFPPKAIRIWPQLHEFERVGLVGEYFLGSGRFRELQTVSVRGLPRPYDDKYFPQRIFSDPVFAVIGNRAG